MGKKTIIEPEAKSGEEVQGSKWNGEHFVKMYQGGLLTLASLSLSGETCKVLFYLLGKLSYSNWINIPQVVIAKDLNLATSNVSKAIKILVSHNIIEVGPAEGRGKTLRVNAMFGFKGNENHADKAKGGLRIIEGGKGKKAKPALVTQEDQAQVS